MSEAFRNLREHAGRERFLRGRSAGKTPMPLRETSLTGATTDPAIGAGSLRAGHFPAEVPPYRRRAVKPRRKRRSRVLLWLRPLLTAGLLVGAGVGAALWLVGSPRFRVETVEVRGEDPVLTAWVEERVNRFAGERLLTLRLERVIEAVGAQPWIGSLEVSRVLPDHLSVEVHERHPAALLESPASVAGRPVELIYADRDGRSIAPVNDPGPGAPNLAPAGDLLRVRGGWGASRGVPQALEIRHELTRAQPSWGAAVTEVEILSESDFLLHTTALRFPIVVRAGQVAAKVHWLERLLPQLVERFGEPAVVDLRFARRIVLENVVEETIERTPERGA